MKTCPECGRKISIFGNKALKCALCGREFCTQCEKEFRREPREKFDEPLCRDCYLGMDEDEMIVYEAKCPGCGKSAVLAVKENVKCSCGATIHSSNMRIVKMRKSQESFVCGNCSAFVPANATVCPVCGAIYE